MIDSPRYRAFVSYSHCDARVAAWAHRSLESYRVPKRLRGTEGEFGPVPERITPVFRDREDLASAGDLTSHVQEALSNSAALIVICSPESARSRWVNEEILAFKRGAHADRIYCLIVAGEPHSGDERECFPPALRFELDAGGQLGEKRAEPIAADIRAGKEGKALARLKLIAGLLGVSLDTLRRREAQRRHRRMFAIAVGATTGMAVALALATTAWVARNEAQRARDDAQRRQAQAEDLLGYMLEDLRPKLEQVGRLDLLDSVDEKEMAYFASLDPADLTDALLVQQARVLTQIGQVRLSQGRFQEALASFRNAYARSGALVDRHPGVGDRLFDRGQAEYYVGYVYWQSRDLERARSWLTRYRDTCREVYAMDPGNADWHRELAYGEHNLAVLELERGDLALAAESFRRSRATLASLLAARPGDIELIFELVDEDSWIGNVEEQQGQLGDAESLLAGKTETLKRIVALRPADPRWKNELSTAGLMQSELLRVMGEYARAAAVADDAVGQMQLLTREDPENRDWSRNYWRALVLRAAARIGLGDHAGARKDLAFARPMLEASEPMATDDRYVRRNLFDAFSLRSQLALQEGDHDGARIAASALGRFAERENNLDSPQAIGRYALGEVIAGMVALDAGQAAGAGTHFAAARKALAPVVHDSRYWRILDPWVRLSLLTGNVDEARRVQARLEDFAYVPLFAWPAGSAAGSADASFSGADAQRRPPTSGSGQTDIAN